MKPKVGVVLLNYNGSGLLRLTLESCLAAKTDVQWSYCVVDNGSQERDCATARVCVQKWQKQYPHVPGHFISTGENKGFSGGNNIGIRYFLQDPQITHVYLLNSDVVVADRWLELLLVEGADVTTPVTNAANAMQGIPVDIDPARDRTALETVRRFGAWRESVYAPEKVQAEHIIFFAVLLSRAVLEQVGLLDERFFPGNFEDDDYCLRLKQAGIPIWTMRGCYVHHWGSASFNKIQTQKAKKLFLENRRKLEQKWNIHWEDPGYALAESCRADMQHLLKTHSTDARAWALVDAGVHQVGERLRQACAAVDDLRNGERPYRELAEMMCNKVRIRIEKRMEPHKKGREKA